MATISPKSRLAALLLCVFLGGLGIHRFYVGKIGTGLLMLFTFGGLGIWVLIDVIMIAVGNFTDKQGRAVTDWAGKDGGSPAATDPATAMEKLVALKQQGHISEEEFQAAKKEILGL